MPGDLAHKKRLKLLASPPYGEALDVGCHDVQNPYSLGVIRLDLKKPANVQPNYEK